MRASCRPPGDFLAGARGLPGSLLGSSGGVLGGSGGGGVWNLLAGLLGGPGGSWVPPGGFCGPPGGCPGGLLGASWGGYWLACLHARGGSVRLHDWQAQDARKWRRKRWRWLQLIPEHEIPLNYESFWCSKRLQEAPGTLTVQASDKKPAIFGQGLKFLKFRARFPGLGYFFVS